MFKCDKKLDEGSRQCNETATLFYQSETRRDVSARCAKHEVIAFKQDQLGKLISLTEAEYAAAVSK